MKTTIYGKAMAIAITSLLLSTPSYAQDKSDWITVVLPDVFGNLDPCNTTSNDTGRIAKQNIAETLTELDMNTGEIKPRLAVSWDVNEDSSWTIHLRENVQFHDGTPLTADAVVTAIQRTLNPALECRTAQKYFPELEVEMNVIDDLTFTLKLPGSQVLLPVPVMLSVIAIGAPTTNPGGLERNPIGTGPYRLVSYEGNEKVVLERFDGYWGKRPAVGGVTYLQRGDSAVQAAMVTTGEADLAPYIAEQDATDPATDHSYPKVDTAQLVMTLNTPPFDDVRVRRAINLAIDREAFIGTIMGKDVQLATQLVYPFVSGYNNDIKLWDYDPEQAKALLAEAKADGVPVDLPITIYTRVGYLPNISDLLSALTQMWQAVGFNANMQIIERSQFFDMVTKPHPPASERSPSLFFNIHDNATGDAATTLFSKYYSEGYQSELADPDLDKLISEGINSIDPKRAELFRTAFLDINQRLVPDAMLFHLAGYARVSPRVNYQPNVLTSYELRIEDITFN